MKVADCSEHLITLIRSAGIENLGSDASSARVVAVDTAEQVLTKLTAGLVKRPAAAVMYEGGRSTVTGNQPGAQLGISGEIVFTVFVLTEKNIIAPNKLPVATETQEVLDAIRNAVQGQKSPTGHKWKWLLEAPAASKDNYLVWLQRWSAPAQMVPR